jgi:predicted MFS family arabinose efflux permease
MVYVCQLAFALVFQSVPPVLSLIVSEFGISHAQGGLLMSLFALPGILLSIPVGLFSDRVGIKKVGLVSLVVMTLGTIAFGASTSFPAAAVGRLVSGMGALTLSIVLPPLLSRWFIRGGVGSAMGIFNTGMPLGIIVSFSLLGILGISLGWRIPILATAAFSALAFIVFLAMYRDPDMTRVEDNMSEKPSASKVGWPVWLVGMAWAWFNAAIISFLTFSQDFLVSRGYAAASASFLSSIVMIGSLVLSPLVGYLANRTGREEVFIIVGGLGLAFTISMIMKTDSSPVIMLAIVGISAALVPPPIFSLPARLVNQHNLGLAFGVVTTCLNVGVLAGPYLVGLAKDLTGSYAASLFLMAIFALLEAATITVLALLRRGSPSPNAPRKA